MSENLQTRTARREAEGRNKKNKKPKKKGLIKKIILTIFLIGLIGLGAGAGLFFYYASSAPKLDEDLLRDPLSSDILYANGDLMYTTGAEKREYVNYEDIPQLMEDAILATEDVRFYKHKGMDFYRLGGAVVANFKRGFGSEGASTLTQQVIKNSFLSSDKTLKRKAQEAWLALQLERHFEKEEIFEMYFNKILMSGNRYGFGTAAEYFYGKPLDELELHEVAMLAGLPQSPNGYNPTTNPERAEKRRNVVLGLMEQHGKITTAEMEEARKVDVTSTLIPEEERKKSDFKYPALLDVVMSELEDAGMLDMVDEGVTIHTTFDPSAQAIVEEAINNDELYIDDDIQGAITVLDTKTGGIVAVGGGRNYTNGTNFARQEKRQLGSTIKPILSYGPAIEHLNWSTGQVVVDEPFKYQGGQEVGNAYPGFLGKMTIREALYKSSNTTAVKTFNEVGHSNSLDFASKIGLNISNTGEGNALGGTQEEFSTIDLAGAYAAFGNSGIYTKPHAISKIVMRDGSVDESTKPKQTVAMKDSTAYMVTDMLRDVFVAQGATGHRANISGLDMAGKTGTTNESKDSWFVGYTTNYTVASWGGYKDRKPMTGFEKERYIPQDLYRSVMSQISARVETPMFQKPSSVEEVSVVYLSNPLVRASASTPASQKRLELFVKNSVPTEVVEEKEEEKIELQAPTDLSADYNEEEKNITLSWKHTAPDAEDFKEDVQFAVSFSVNGGASQELTTTDSKTLTLNDAEEGNTYTFSVVAIAGDLKSDAATVTVEIAKEEEPEEEEPVEEEEPEEEPEVDEEVPVEEEEEVDVPQEENGNDNEQPDTNEPEENNGQNNPDQDNEQDQESNNNPNNNQGNREDNPEAEEGNE